MVAASFIRSNGRVDFSRCPDRPDGQLSALQPDLKTPAGISIGFNQVVNKEIISLKLRVTKVELDTLKAFMFKTVKGMARTFDYSDPQGVVVAVRFAEPYLRGIKEIAPNEYQLNLKLRVA